MKTVKPLLAIGAAFLVNIVTEYIVDATTAELVNTDTDGLKLSESEMTALAKISLTKEKLKKAVNAENVYALEEALNVVDDKWIEVVIRVLDKALEEVEVKEDPSNLLTDTDKELIKEAVGKAVKVVREVLKETAALKKIGLTLDNLMKAVTKHNVASVDDALQFGDEDWEILIGLLKEGAAMLKPPVEVQEDSAKSLGPEEKGHIRAAVRKAVTAVYEAALSLIGLTTEKLKKALRETEKDNLDDTEKAWEELRTNALAPFDDEWAELIKQLNIGLAAAGLKLLNPDDFKNIEKTDKFFIGTIVANWLRAVRQEKQETALGKIGLTAVDLKQAVEVNLVAVETALVAAEKEEENDAYWKALIKALDVKVEEDEANKLEPDDKGHIKDAVRKAVTTVRQEKQETALNKIGLTEVTLKQAVEKNLVAVEKALVAVEKAEDNVANWKALIKALDDALDVKVEEDQENKLEPDDKGHIKDAVRKAVTAVAWKIALSCLSVKDKEGKSNDNVKEDEIAVNSKGDEIYENHKNENDKEDQNNNHDENGDVEGKEPTDNASDAYLASVIMLAPLAKWYFF